MKDLFDRNKKWAEKIKSADTEFFTRLSKNQEPEYLWIGCSDSRVPETGIVDMMPGDVFVHRNIANVVAHTDLNCLSVIQYAVEVLKVKQIVVCGHYGCGGVNAVMDNQEHGLIDNWLRNVKDVYRFHERNIEKIEDKKERADFLCELNVVEQVHNVCYSTIVQNAWNAGRELAVHGWIYRLEDGILRDLNTTITNKEEMSHAQRIKML